MDVLRAVHETAVAFYEATGWRHSHPTDADWTPDGRAVQLRRYIRAARTPDTDASHADSASPDPVGP